MSRIANQHSPTVEPSIDDFVGETNRTVSPLCGRSLVNLQCWLATYDLDTLPRESNLACLELSGIPGCYWFHDSSSEKHAHT